MPDSKSLGQIKPLKWRYDKRTGRRHADCLVGTYTVYQHMATNGAWFWAGPILTGRSAHSCRDAEAGEAAAQADYEARVRAVLVKPPPSSIDPKVYRQVVEREIAMVPPIIKAEHIRVGLAKETVDPQQGYVTIEDCLRYVDRVRAALSLAGEVA